MNSLKATIKSIRPDLIKDELEDGVLPIPEEMPPAIAKPVNHIEGVGEPVTAINFTKTDMDPSNW